MKVENFTGTLDNYEQYHHIGKRAQQFKYKTSKNLMQKLASQLVIIAWGFLNPQIIKNPQKTMVKPKLLCYNI